MDDRGENGGGTGRGAPLGQFRTGLEEHPSSSTGVSLQSNIDVADKGRGRSTNKATSRIVDGKVSEGQTRIAALIAAVFRSNTEHI